MTSDVTAVIPTVGRRTLERAVSSCLSQDRAAVEVMVVADLPDVRHSRRLLEEALGGAAHDVRVIFTGGGAGAATARQLGTVASSAEWVAYLDDDDWWLPEKTMTQLKAAQSLGDDVVLSCRVMSVDQATGVRTGPIPRAIYRSDQDLAEYLFLRRRLSADRNAIFLPTLLMKRDVALRTGWEKGLRRHQDWDFLMRVIEIGSATIHQLDEVLAVISVGSPGSLSASSDWRTSLEWAQRHKSTWSPQVYRDFVAGQPLRYAFGDRSMNGVMSCLGASFDGGRPSGSALALALVGLIPRGTVNRFLHRSKKPSTTDALSER